MNTYSSLGMEERMMIRNHLHSTFPIIQAVIEGAQQGQVFKNAWEDYWVVHKAGFSEVFLNADEGMELLDFVIKNSDLPDYFHIYNPPEKLVDVFKSRPGIFNIRQRERIQLKYDEKQIVHNSRYQLDDEFNLTEVTRENIDSLDVFNLDIANKFWNGKEEFVKNALGVCITDKQNIPVSLCYAASIAGHKAEVDVVTSIHHREKGLAKSVVASFVVNCIQKNVVPNWDCFANNEASLSTAMKAGFVNDKVYDFISIYRK